MLGVCRRCPPLLAAARKQHHFEQSPWQILGVKRGVDEKIIKGAYKKLAKKHHPDVAGGDEKKFAAVTAAFKSIQDGTAQLEEEKLQAESPERAQRRHEPSKAFKKFGIKWGDDDEYGFGGKDKSVVKHDPYGVGPKPTRDAVLKDHQRRLDSRGLVADVWRNDTEEYTYQRKMLVWMGEKRDAIWLESVGIMGKRHLEHRKKNRLKMLAQGPVSTTGASNFIIFVIIWWAVLLFVRRYLWPEPELISADDEDVEGRRAPDAVEEAPVPTSDPEATRHPVDAAKRESPKPPIQTRRTVAL